MESLNEVLERNRQKATDLMLANDISHISITDNEEYGMDADVPVVLLANKNGEVYETDVTDIKLVRGNIFTKDDIYIKVVNTTDLSSNVSVDNEGYISINECYYHTANEVYYAIEFYFENGLYFDNKIDKLNKEIDEKIIKLLSDEDERTFTFGDSYIFHTCIGTKDVSFNTIYMKGNIAMLEDSENHMVFNLSGISLEDKYDLLKHLIVCINKC